MKFNSITNPIKEKLLISFFDLTSFISISRKLNSQEIFYFLNEIYEITGEIVESNNGKVVKFIGDAGLIIFKEEDIDSGILSLLKLKEKLDEYLEKSGFKSKAIFKCHFGEAIIGLIGTKNNKQLDVVGESVNIAATVKSHGFSMTPETFRKLSKETRKHFKKHTPTIRYIPIDEKHRD